MSQPKWAAIAFDLALLAYPRAFRRHFAVDMRADFRASAVAMTARETLGVLGHIVASGLAERVTAMARVLASPAHQPHLYDSPGRPSMRDTLLSDVRHALRLARKTPGFTALTVAALALGIGANSAIFTVVSSVLLRPLPYAAPDRLVTVWSDNTKERHPNNPISPANFDDFRRHTTTLIQLEGYFSFLINQSVVIDGTSEMATGVNVTSGMFALLGREAALGRTMTPSDGDGVVVLSHGYWRRRFGGDPSVIGRQLTVSDRPMTVIGVMPSDFVFPYRGMLGPSGFTRTLATDVWVPLPLTGPRIVDRNGQLVRNVHFFGAAGRLRPDASIEQARADLASIAAALEEQYPDSNAGWKVTVVPVHEQVVGAVRPALLVLLAGVGLVLLMATVNVTNLVLARSVARQKELAVRVALGAGRRRLLQQAFTEGLLLAAAGGLLGLLLVQWGVRALVAIAPANVPRLVDIRPDATVLLFTLVVSAVTGLLVAVAPAFAVSSGDVQGALQESGRGTAGSRSRRRLRSALVVVEVALAAVLTIGAGLLLRSFVTLLDVDPGFHVDRLLTLQMNLPARLATPDARLAFYRDFFARMERLPGVVSVGGTTRLPLGSTNVSTSVQVEGRNVPVSELPEIELRRAMHDYFRTMGIPILRGRGFTPEDGPGAVPVVVISHAAAARIFPGDDPIGRRVRLGPGPDGAWLTIVGVIGDVRHAGLEQAPEPEVYLHYLQGPPVAPFIVLQTTGAPEELADLVRAEARTLDRTMPLYDIRTMGGIRAESVAERRFLLALIGVFGLLALTLAAIGVYGVMSLMVSERTQEVGVRLALGARPEQVVQMLVGHAGRLVLIGVAAGVGLSVAIMPLLRTQLYAVPPHDPLTLVSVPLVLIAVAIVAAVIPARRAMRVNPIEALRYE